MSPTTRLYEALMNSRLGLPMIEGVYIRSSVFYRWRGSLFCPHICLIDGTYICLANFFIRLVFEWNIVLKFSIFFFIILMIFPVMWLCVFLSVCVCVCSLLNLRLNIFLPPLPKVWCPKFLRIWNPWGKVMDWYQCFSLHLTAFLPTLEVKCPNFLDFRNPLGKVIERSGLRSGNYCS